MSTTRTPPKPIPKAAVPATRPTPLQPYLWMLCSCAAFAVMGACARGLRTQCDWQVIALARSSVALVVAAILVVAAGKRFVLFTPRVLWMRSFAGSVSLICTFYAFTRLPMGDVFTLTNMVPLWVALLSWPLLGRPPAANVWVCVVLGLAGVALIQQPHLAEGNFAALLAIVSSFTSAIAMLGLNRLRDIDHRAIVVHFSAVATVVSIGALFVFEQTHPYADILEMPTALALLGTGLAAAVGQLFLTRAYADGSPSKVAVVGLSQIVFAMALDVVLFDHGVTGVTLLGIGLVVGPTAWVLLRRSGAPESLR